MRTDFGTVLVTMLATWGRMARRATSYDTDRICDIHCDAMTAARFYDRRAF